MLRKTVTWLVLIVLSCLTAQAQTRRLQQSPDSHPRNGSIQDGAGNRMTWGNGTNSDMMDDEGMGSNGRGRGLRSRGGEEEEEEEEEIPVGQFQWRIDPRLGTIIEAANADTVVHNFQNFNLTEGYTGQYSMLSNLGSPRLNRVYMNREEHGNFMFLDPLSFFRGSLADFRFTNTLSPITNLAYHKCGNSQNGEDRVRAYFATNINKVSGLGFKVDYLYGRGYYLNSSTSMFGGTAYAYHLGEKYNVHAYVNVNHMKEGENGGIEDDKYIEDPQSFPQSFSSIEIPTVLSRTWNRNHEQTFYLTHKLNAGIWRDIYVPDSLKPKMPSDAEFFTQLNDSMRVVAMEDSIQRGTLLDSLRTAWEQEQEASKPREFIPVTSFIHTFELNRLTHNYIAKETPANYYTDHFYGEWNNVDDETKALCLRNTLGVALREGFNKWAQMGLTFFATHRLRTYNLPMIYENDFLGEKTWTENDLSFGAELSRMQGKLIHYDMDGELWTAGEKAGDFKLDGNLDVNVHLGKAKADSITLDTTAVKRDSILFKAHAMLAHETPDFYMRHYHSQSAWWDNHGLDRQLRTRIDGSLEYSKTKTRLCVGVENITNYTYFGMQNTLLGKDSTSLVPADYSHSVAVMQEGGNVQVFSATLSQDFKVGPLHLDNEVTYQTSSNQEVLPLPDLSVYSNLYLLFHIAKILRVQLGGDVRYFTSYYAPDFAPNIQQFAVQDNHYARAKVGNYPIVNVYLNMHLKHCRIYLAMNHINQGSGHAFWAPHYPVNPRSFHFGVSWNFFN